MVRNQNKASFFGDACQVLWRQGYAQPQLVKYLVDEPRRPQMSQTIVGQV